ncbi:MAG: carboxypeptidase regulatory-like domain-containing protein [Rhodococcus sp.]|nr:carboxypeptidase regulatory-like domain-containing protein [Rhodococcus sp. (in: high G+C Gram-positive bacteria)]
MLRTVTIMGQVSVEGEGLADVTVSLSGEGESHTTMPDMSGQYAFSKLPAGNFQVGISGYDTDDYSFETTSKNVAVALGETATVPFEGILLRTSGISGRVSVEGTGQDSVTVTLSGDDLEDDMTTMTDASGQYAFAGLAEGDYTVAISGYDDDAYDFETTSMDVTLGDDDVQIVNFMGMHDRSASVKGKIYVDEAGKNDSYDEGEHALAAPGIVLALVGPGILDQAPGVTGPDGSFSITGRRAGTYQLVVANAAAAGPDYAYGGPAEGYAIVLGVGDEETQNIPFDITHQTVNFSVTLKREDEVGPALAGATVSFFSDEDGEQKIDDAEAGADGVASLRFARSMATNDTVYVSVAAPEGTYHTSGAMQAVTWDAKSPTSTASNDADIVNTMAKFSFGGATVDRGDYGGGNALGGWKVSVTSGADDEAVDGAPIALKPDGMASFSETVTSVPKTYKIAMVGWEDQVDDSTGTNGERYTSTTLSYIHDGLSLSLDDETFPPAGMLEVTYTTQTLRVYVHQEIDQVMGYTGNVLGGDGRENGFIEVDIAYIDDTGRVRSFSRADGDTIGGDSYSDRIKSAVTFTNVPADRNVIVTAETTDDHPTLKDEDGDPVANTVHLLDKNGHSDEIAAYTDVDANGIEGGLFGANGGFHHTVDLCPLISDEGDQRYGDCSTFAFVETYEVDGQAWMWERKMQTSGDDFVSADSKAGLTGLTVSMDPVDGENLAGKDDSFEEKGNTKEFDFGRMPAGVYKVTTDPESGLKVQRGPLEDPTDDLAARLNPLDSALNIDVTPTTGFAYGTVTDDENRRLEGVEVTVNGADPVETDEYGRYVVYGFGKKSCPGSGSTESNLICVTTAEEESEETATAATFVANSPTRIDVVIKDAEDVTTISGRVTHSDGGAGLNGVRINVVGGALLNPNARSGSRGPNNIYRTHSGGYYSVETPTQTNGGTVKITASRDDLFFSPDEHTVTAVGDPENINFTAFDKEEIHGRVVDGSDDPIGDVIVKAMQGDVEITRDTTTSTTGRYSLFVRYGQYTVTAEKHGYDFTEATGITVPNDGKAQDDLEGTPQEGNAELSSLSLSDVDFEDADGDEVKFDPEEDEYTATVENSVDMTTVTYTKAVAGQVVSIYPDDADGSTSGHQIELDVGDNKIEIDVVSADKEAKTEYRVTVTRRAASTIITGTITDTELDEDGDPKGVDKVEIRVTGGTLIDGDRFNSKGYVTTNADGEYKAEVEPDVAGGTGTVTPNLDDYTFEPGSRSVTLNAGTVSGIDFTGSAYGTITGTVSDENGKALMGVSVTAGSAEATTDRRGRYSVSVPAGDVDVTAKMAGYSFTTRSVNVTAGETRTLNFTAMNTIQATNVEGERDTVAATGAYDGEVTVTWEAGGAGTEGVTYAVQWCIKNADATPAVTCEADDVAWDNNAFGTWSAGDDLEVEATAPDDSDNGFMVRVMASTDPDDTPDTGDEVSLTSDAAPVAAINVSPSDATAERDVGVGRFGLTVDWDGARAVTGTSGRIIASFDEGETWVVLGTATIDFTDVDATDGTGYTASVADDEPDHTWLFQLAANATANVVDGDDGTAVANDPDTTDDESQLEVTNAMLEGAFMIRVQMRHEGVDESDDNPPVDIWKASNSADVGAS